jgi:hypothetical protein
MTEYKVAKTSLVISYFTMVLLLLLAVTFVTHQLITEPDPEGIIFGVLWITFIFLMGYSLFKKPHSIAFIKEHKVLNFKSQISQQEIQIKNIKNIKTNKNRCLLIFNHSAGKIVVFNRIDNLFELINEIKSINPKVTTQGPKNGTKLF